MRLGPAFLLKIPISGLNMAHDLGSPCAILRLEEIIEAVAHTDGDDISAQEVVNFYVGMYQGERGMGFGGVT